MLRTTLNKIKKVWALAFATRGRCDAKAIREKFHKSSNSVLMRAKNSTKAGKDREAHCKICQQLIDSLFGPAVTIDDTSIRRNTTHDQNTEDPSHITTNLGCANCNQLIDKFFGTNETIVPEKAETPDNPIDVDQMYDICEVQKSSEQRVQKNEIIDKTPGICESNVPKKTEVFDNPLDVDHIYDVYAFQKPDKHTDVQLPQKIDVIDKTQDTRAALNLSKTEILNNPLNSDGIKGVYALKTTTSKQNEEQLTQKIETIEETSLVEAEKQKIEGFNVTPRVLGQITANEAIIHQNIAKNKHLVNFASDDSHRKNNGGTADADIKNSFDAIAKRCLETPTSRIDERIIKEIKKLGVPQTGSRENSKIKVQIDVIKKRKPVEKTEVELEAKRFESEPYVLSEELHPEIQVAPGFNNTSIYDYDPAQKQLMYSELTASKSGVIEVKEIFDSDPRPKFDPKQVIIDPFDKKTIALDTDNYGYEPLEPLIETRRKQSSQVNISEDFVPMFADQKTPIQATGPTPNLICQQILYSVFRKEFSDGSICSSAEATEEKNVAAAETPERLIHEGAPFINRQTSFERASLALSMLDVKELAKVTEKKAEPCYYQAREEFARNLFVQSEPGPSLDVDPLINQEPPCNPPDSTVSDAENFDLIFDSLPALNPKDQTLTLSEMLRRVRLRNRTLSAAEKRLKRRVLDPEGKCGNVKPHCPPVAPQCPPTPPACPEPPKAPPCPRPCRPHCPPSCPCSAEPPRRPGGDPCAPFHKPKGPCCTASEQNPCDKQSLCSLSKPKDSCVPSKPKDPCGPPKMDKPCQKTKRSPCSSPSKPKDSCASVSKSDPCGSSKPKDPCAKFNKTFWGVASLDDMIPVVLNYARTILSSRNSHFLDTVLTRDIAVPLPNWGSRQHSTSSCNLWEGEGISENIVLARSFEPWVPIPSWPTPKKYKKEPLQCPKDGCKQRPQPPPDPCRERAGEPCSDFPRPRRHFSLTNVEYTFLNM